MNGLKKVRIINQLKQEKTNMTFKDLKPEYSDFKKDLW
jgi:hypothetical protein